MAQSFLNSAYSGIKVLLVQVLGREWDTRILPRARRVKLLPGVLSVSEALSIVNAPKNLKHRTILRLLYATGLRMGELLRLRVSDVDSKRMVLPVRQGKGFKDRQVPMSEVLLDSLRKYWIQFRPKEYLFESACTGGALSARTIQVIFQKAKCKAGVTRQAGVHTLRHCYAHTH
ncbi:MAG: tyrosine-type recombinase/integrase [Saprospiraceae bacterium]|nr:tyrosine-type recombinase/integrase [Saprospiraceae bacterium]